MASMAMLKNQRVLSVSQVTPPLPTPCRCRTVSAGAAGESRLLHLCRHRLSGGWPCLRLQRRWRLQGIRGILGISRHGWCPLKRPTCPTFGLPNYPVTGLILSNISKLGRARRWGSTADAWVYAGLGGEEWGDADQGGPRLMDGIING